MSRDELFAGRYEILSELGSGAGGAVYEARQVSTGQTVAIKLLTLDALDEGQRTRRVERFRREITFCSQLYHPDIVRLLDSGQVDDGRHFAVFEFIPGSTLARLLTDAGMLGVQRACNVMANLLPPLAYAHAKGIFHRDLKPSNIMVTTDGARDRLKILDFGISIAAEQEHDELARLTLSHEWVGTPTYASPEQLRGEPAGAKSDLYAWGLIFLECLTGASVVRGRSLPEILEQQLRPDPHVLPASLRNHRLGALLLRVLEKNPARRSGDADALLATLETISTNDLEDGQGYLRDTSQHMVRARIPVVHSDTLVTDDRPRPAERRDATVVACHITFDGKGTLSGVELLDTLIEDTNVHAREILTQFGADTCHSFGGYCLAYFGLLRARETDARVALRAALDTIARLLERAPEWLSEQGLSLRVQLGIHNGPVTVQQREGRRQPVDGVTAAVATSLASLEVAEDVNDRLPRVLVSDRFRELVTRFANFRTVPLENRQQRPWHGAAGGVYRLAAEAVAVDHGLGDRSVFVGRRRELARLHEMWVRSRTPAAVAALVVGEAGIGKSRLARELRGRLRDEGVVWLEACCLPEWQNAFLRPLSSLVVHELKLAGLDPDEAGKTLERRILDLNLNSAVAVPLFCDWLALSLPRGYTALAWSPQKRRQVLLELLADALIVSMERGAALLVEDLQWADPSTLECLDLLLSRARARARATFVVMTSRRTPLPSWTVPPEEVPLAGLDPEAVKQLASSLVPELTPDQLAAARVAERSDGVPLYVEELAMALRSLGASRLESGQEGQGPRSSLVPPSLRDLLTSHLEEVGDAKRVAQIAGALGRDFSLEVLAASANADEQSLLGDLEQLVSAGVIVKRVDDRAGYLFRHVLIRDTAYESMPQQVRQETHARIAQALERRFRAVADTQPDIVAHHWERAGHAERALDYWKIAATNSARASAHLEALAQLDRAIALLPQLPEAARSVNEAELMLARAATNVAKRGYTDPDAARCFERVMALVAPEGQTLELAFAARWGLWYFHNTQANLLRSGSLAEELLSLSRGANDSSLSVSAWTARCETSFCIGRLEESVEASRQCEAAYDFERHRHLCTVRGDDPLLASLSFEALAEMIRGRYESANARAAQGLALAERLEYPSLRAGMHAQTAWLYLVWGASGARSPDLTRARKHAGIAAQLADEYGFPFWQIYAGMIDAAARIASGETDALGALRQGAEIWRHAGARLGRCWHLTFIGEALRNSGDHDGALSALDEALVFCDEHDSRYFEPEVRRQRAEVLLHPTNPQRDVESARNECVKALAAAAKHEAYWWSLASAMTALRSHDAAEPADRSDVLQALRRFPVAVDEPPLLREARALVRSENAAGAMRT
jgi:TOMM system kinase/cyclase fusion protein